MGLKRSAVLAALVLCLALPARPATLVLNKSFVQKIMNAATVTATLEIDSYARAPHPNAINGDLPIAGRSSDIGLPLVVKIGNAALEKEALSLLFSSTPSHPLPVTGAWRIWFEHAGSAPQVQGAPVDFPRTSNPDHVFEIHPLSHLGSLALTQAFEPVAGFVPASAKVAFASYETRTASVSASTTAIVLNSVPAAYNYVEFVLELAGKPQDVGDGLLALANIVDPGDATPVAAAPRRVVFVKGTAPARKAMGLGIGGRLRVMGIPRVNLNEVFAIARKVGGRTVSVPLPYELIVVALLDK